MLCKFLPWFVTGVWRWKREDSPAPRGSSTSTCGRWTTPPSTSWSFRPSSPAPWTIADTCTGKGMLLWWWLAPSLPVLPHGQPQQVRECYCHGDGLQVCSLDNCRLLYRWGSGVVMAIGSRPSRTLAHVQILMSVAIMGTDLLRIDYTALDKLNCAIPSCPMDNLTLHKLIKSSRSSGPSPWTSADVSTIKVCWHSDWLVEVDYLTLRKLIRSSSPSPRTTTEKLRTFVMVIDWRRWNASPFTSWSSGHSVLVHGQHRHLYRWRTIEYVLWTWAAQNSTGWFPPPPSPMENCW